MKRSTIEDFGSSIPRVPLRFIQATCGGKHLTLLRPQLLVQPHGELKSLKDQWLKMELQKGIDDLKAGFG